MDTAGERAATALEMIWNTLRERSPELPDVSVTIVSTGAPHNLVWPADGRRAPELPVHVSTLREGPRAALEAVVHAAVHALCHVRGVSETSNRGQRHNRKYMETARELGMVWPDGAPPHGVKGFSPIPLSDDALEGFGDLLTTLGAALEKTDALDVPQSPTAGTSGSRLNLVCGCGRTMQMGRRVYAQGPVLCGVCGKPFVEKPAE